MAINLSFLFCCRWNSSFFKQLLTKHKPYSVLTDDLSYSCE
ncbi:MAG: hypothetical protein MRECE_5c032 [Mycoplasmataceae bacterium CE_OT135]|nr:MAG: hypothetical protein MRECE_6c049 [Mycoplasmataceae bacterium CE_OT135]KLL03987.1 MAG: hypothetical protein MRECE_5c032 [Mycoplasmataceae bacterium CE_OT135]